MTERGEIGAGGGAGGVEGEGEAGAKGSGEGDFAIHFQPTDIGFPINLFNVYDNIIDPEILSHIESQFESRFYSEYETPFEGNDLVSTLEDDYDFVISMTSPTEFDMEVYYDKKAFLAKIKSNLTGFILDKTYIDAVKHFICCLLVNNQDWGELMFQITSEKREKAEICKFRVKVNYISRSAETNYIHKDHSLFSSLTYLNKVSETPEFSFSYNEIPRDSGDFPHQDFEITQAIFNEFVRLELASRENPRCGNIYRFMISFMTQPTVSFSDWIMYHGTPSNLLEDTPNTISRGFDSGDRMVNERIESFTTCNGRSCKVTDPSSHTSSCATGSCTTKPSSKIPPAALSQGVKRKIIRLTIDLWNAKYERNFVKIFSIEHVDITNSNAYKKVIPCITITSDNFTESVRNLQSKDGIYLTDTCRIAQNVGGKARKSKRHMRAKLHKRTKRRKQHRSSRSKRKRS